MAWQVREEQLQLAANEASLTASQAEEDQAAERSSLAKALADVTSQAELVRPAHTSVVLQPG